MRWTGLAIQDLGTLGGQNSIGFGINASGQVVGEADTGLFYLGATNHDAVVWTGTTPTDLGTLGGSRSTGAGINVFGDVVGMSFTLGEAANHAFVYTGGTMYDLSTLIQPGSGVIGLQATAINDSGQIAGFGTISGQRRALRLDPVATPEPASALLLFGGGSLLALRRRRG